MKRKEKLRKAGLILLITAGIITIYALTVNFHIVNREKDRILTTEQARQEPVFDCILVLGSRVYEDGTPSPLLKYRLNRGVELFEDGISDRLLLSGDHYLRGYDEVNPMKDYVMKYGIMEECIFMDHAGVSTYDSLYRAKYIFEAQRILVVTQQYHLYRALYIAEALGLEAYGVSSDGNDLSGQFYRDVREILARNKDFLKCMIKPEAMFMGEPIPIDGDGRITNDK